MGEVETKFEVVTNWIGGYCLRINFKVINKNIKKVE